MAKSQIAKRNKITFDCDLNNFTRLQAERKEGRTIAWQIRQALLEYFQRKDAKRRWTNG